MTDDKSKLLWVAALDLPKKLHKLIVPATRFSGGLMVPEVSWYMEDGALSISLVDPLTAEPSATATVCLDRPPPDFHLYLKDWAQNEGIPEALVAAGIVTLTGGARATGQFMAREAKITARFHQMLKG